MNRRTTALKWLHWGSLFLMLYFFFVEPEDVERLGAAALGNPRGRWLHVLAVVVVLWFAMFVTKGLASRAGPKLPAWAKNGASDDAQGHVLAGLGDGRIRRA